jgi:outer membrane lipoprotein SlyB
LRISDQEILVMKNLVNEFRSAKLHNQVLVVVETLAILAVLLLLAAEKAHAQAGNIYSPQQAQAAGEVWEGVVLQVSIKEVEPTYQARAAGVAAGGTLGLALANRSGTVRNRFAVNTVGAIVGGLVGERVASSAMTARAQEILVRLQPIGQIARTIIIIQPLPADSVAAGTIVYVTRVQGAWRVLPRLPM